MRIDRMAVSFGTFDAGAFREFGLGIVVVAIGFVASVVVVASVIVARSGEKTPR